MTSMRITMCPKCHRPPTVYKPFARPGYAITCQECGGLLSFGNDYESAVICWNRSVDLDL